VISVIIPTVEGREDYLERCVKAYTAHAGGGYELDLIIEHDHPSCGAGWQAGLARARGEYIHLSDDDIEPQPGWHVPAIEAVRLGFLPAPQVCDPNGHPQSHPQEGVFSPDWTPVHQSALPFASREQTEKIAPLLTCHYYCVVPETPVLTAGLEWLPAGKLSIGDELVGVEEFAQSQRGRRYRRALVTGNSLCVMPCVAVRLEDGRKVECSLEHPWLASRGHHTFQWIEAEHLRRGDRISSPLRVWNTDTSYEAGWLAGILDGEGTAGRYMCSDGYDRPSVGIGQNPGLVLNRIKDVLDAMDIRYTEARNSTRSNVVKLNIRALQGMLELLGRVRPVRLQASHLWDGMHAQSKNYGVVVEVEPVGLREVAALGTSTRTFLANGLVSHNTDDWFSWRGQRAGWPTVLRSNYKFVHAWAQHKRGAGMSQEQRMVHDQRLYEEARRRADAGEWNGPWPPNGGLPEAARADVAHL
jgi:hypothetical protein